MLETDDDTLGENMAKWGTFIVEGGKKIGRSFTVLEDGTQRKAMEEAGFVDIQERDFKVKSLFSLTIGGLVLTLILLGSSGPLAKR